MHLVEIGKTWKLEMVLDHEKLSKNHKMLLSVMECNQNVVQKLC